MRALLMRAAVALVMSAGLFGSNSKPPEGEVSAADVRGWVAQAMAYTQALGGEADVRAAHMQAWEAEGLLGINQEVPIGISGAPSDCLALIPRNIVSLHDVSLYCGDVTETSATRGEALYYILGNLGTAAKSLLMTKKTG